MWVVGEDERAGELCVGVENEFGGGSFGGDGAEGRWTVVVAGGGGGGGDGGLSWEEDGMEGGGAESGCGEVGGLGTLYDGVEGEGE